MQRKRNPTLVALLVLVVAMAACATLNPGEDPVIVHAQQTLAIGQNVYDSGMKWSQANAANFSVAGLKLVNQLRVDFPPAYRAVDTALDAYKAGKTGDLVTALDKFTTLVGQIEAIVAGAGGPDLAAQAAAAKVGTP